MRHASLAASLAAGALMVTAGPATAAAGHRPASPAVRPAVSVVTCKPYAVIRVATSWGANLAVRNDTIAGSRECLRVRDDRPAFTVLRSAASTAGTKTQAFPEIFRGCVWGACTRDSGLPVRVSALRNPESSWHARLHAAGRWDAGYDLWFDRRPIRTGQATSAELMIWMSARRLGSWAGTPVVTLDGAQWYLRPWRTRSASGKSWYLVVFRRRHPASKVNDLDLLPFIQVMERNRLVSSRDWLLNIEAGFEIWSGGRGLGTTWFWAAANHATTIPRCHHGACRKGTRA